MAVILGIESTCDETAAAVVVDGRRVRSNVVATQFELHAKYRGVVPEIASRAHLATIVPVLREAAEAAGVALAHVDAVAVASRPGLIGSLLIGVTAAKTLAWALGKPLIAVDHVQAHLYSVVLEEGLGTGDWGLGGSRQGSARTFQPPVPSPPSPIPNPQSPIPNPPSPIPNPPSPIPNPQSPVPNPQPPVPNPQSPTPSPQSPVPNPQSPLFPAVGLVCSGGHTALYRVGGWTDVTLIGSTVDDAVGEAYDKVAAILGLGYPGGPVLDRLAADGDPAAVRLPRSMMDRDSLDFSFSGLKTAVLYHVRGVPTRQDRHPAPKPPPGEAAVRDIAASFQAAAVGVLVEKVRRAVGRVGARSVIVGGGVSGNRGLRAALATVGVPAFVPPLAYCTDNAAMIAGLADVHFAAGRFADLGLDAVPYSEIPRR